MRAPTCRRSRTRRSRRTSCRPPGTARRRPPPQRTRWPRDPVAAERGFSRAHRARAHARAMRTTTLPDERCEDGGTRSGGVCATTTTISLRRQTRSNPRNEQFRTVEPGIVPEWKEEPCEPNSVRLSPSSRALCGASMRLGLGRRPGTQGQSVHPTRSATILRAVRLPVFRHRDSRSARPSVRRPLRSAHALACRFRTLPRRAPSADRPVDHNREVCCREVAAGDAGEGQRAK
jgi:hypothetical protein